MDREHSGPSLGRIGKPYVFNALPRRGCAVRYVLTATSRVLSTPGEVAGEDSEPEALDRTGQPLAVFPRPPEVRHPREVAFDDPSPGQQDEASLGLRQLHDVQRDPVVVGVVFRLLAGVALVLIGQVHVLAGGLDLPLRSGPSSSDFLIG